MFYLKIAITQNLAESREIDNVLVVGRGCNNDIVLLDSKISREHARFFIENQQVYVEDLNSANGVFVNNERVFYRLLQNGDIVQIGNTTMCLVLEHEQESLLNVDLTHNELDNSLLQKILSCHNIIFHFFSESQAIEKILDIIAHKLSTLNLDAGEQTNLEYALNEAVGNAQRHGHKYNEELIIKLHYLQQDNKLVIRITDQGQGFDYRNKLQYCQGVSAVDAARERYSQGGYGGLGMKMMLACVDKVEYNRKGNQVTLSKFLNPPSSETLIAQY